MEERKRIRRQFIALLTMFAILVAMGGFTAKAAEANNASLLHASNSILPDNYHISMDGNKVTASFDYSAEPEGFVYASLECSDTENGTYTGKENLYYWELSTTSTNTIEYTPKGDGKTMYYRLHFSTIYDDAYTQPEAFITEMDVPDWNTDSTAFASYATSGKISWKRSENVASYVIYRSNNQNRGFKEIGRLKNPKIPSGGQMEHLWSFDSGLSPNKTYYYRIAAVGKTGAVSEPGEVFSMKTEKKPKSYSAQANLPNFKSYTGISGNSSTQKNIYGIQQKTVTYRNVTEDMYRGYLELLGKSIYQLQVYGNNTNACYFDYMGGALIKRGSVVKGSSDSYYGSYDLYASFDGSKKIMTLAFSPSFKLKAIAKNQKYKNTGSNGNSGSGGANAGGSGLKLCPTCMGTGNCGYCHGARICPVCHGRGGMSYNTWGQGGSGWVNCSGCQGSKRCSRCGGSGKCKTCNGSGKR